jgi:hypothetical protein
VVTIVLLIFGRFDCQRIFPPVEDLRNGKADSSKGRRRFEKVNAGSLEVRNLRHAVLYCSRCLTTRLIDANAMLIKVQAATPSWRRPTTNYKSWQGGSRFTNMGQPPSSANASREEYPRSQRTHPSCCVLMR